MVDRGRRSEGTGGCSLSRVWSRLVALVPTAALILILAACQQAGASPGPATAASNTPGPTHLASPSPSPSRASATGHESPSPPAVATVAAQVINVTLTDAIRIEPAQIRVTSAIPVIFRVTNVGVLIHEFYVGDEAAQAAHEAQMIARGGNTPLDERNGIGLEPGETKDLTLGFALPGVVLAGCHITNHYSGGMKATITITE